MMTLRARSKGQTFASLIDDSLPRLWADERALRQIVLNLLSNAVKFTPPCRVRPPGCRARNP
jgi:two-component system cell cycle sensor histidine kinase PleC